MPPSRRIRKRTTRAEEAAEQAAAEAAAATREESAVESKSEKKTKKTKKKKRDTTSTSAEQPKITVPTKEELESAAISSILPQSIEDDPSSLLTHLLVEIQSLASSKKRCTDALRALKDGRGLATPHTTPEDGGEGDDDKKEEETTPSTGRGTKRTRAADKKKKKKEKEGAGGGPLSFEVIDGEDYFNSEENAPRIRDAHLIMATTQAINVLIAYLKKCKEDKVQESVKHVALVMAALSHHLMTSLVNDKSLLESITKSSQYSGMHSSMQSSLGAGTGGAPYSSTWGRILDDDATMEDTTPTSLRGRKKESETSESMQQKLERNHKVIVSYAKAVAGRAMTSCVVGAMDAMEALGELKLGDDVQGKSSDDDEENRDDQTTEYTLLRRGIWTCLLALETAFQLNSKPKLLMTSSMSVSAMPASAGISSYPGEMDFDGMMSGVMGSPPGGGGSSSNTTKWVHTHNMMGSNTIAMWNGLLQQIMLDYKLGFNLQHESSDQHAEDENQLLSLICREIAENAFLDENDSKFISMVLEKSVDKSVSSSDEPPSKKTKRTTKAKKPVKKKPLQYELSELSVLLAQRQENFILFDCHVSVRRWSTLAFGWLCSGQPRFLETCMNILTQKEWWKKVLEMSPVDSTTIASHAPKPSASKKKTKDLKTPKLPLLSPDATLSTSRNKFGSLRGDLALVILTSCMVDLISAGGISPSNSGWIDEYVKAITNTPGTESSFAASTKRTDADTNDDHPVRRSARAKSTGATAKTSAKSKTTSESPVMSPKGGKKSVASWVRPNVTNEVAFLTKLLIEAHSVCLQDSFRDHLLGYSSTTTLKNVDASFQMRKLLVNDDDSYRDSMSYYRRSESKLLVNSIAYYPFMHRTLETLGRMAAASAFIPSSSRKSRIQAIGGALVLGHFANHYRKVKDEEDNVVVLDAKLVSLAVAQLSDVFNNIVKKNNATETVDRSDGSPCDETAFSSFLVKYRLNEPLGIERKKSEMDESDMDPRVIEEAISYSGAFAPSSNETAAVQMEILSCFIRAQLNETSDEDSHTSGMESFISSLLFIVDMCYEFPSERQTSELRDTKRKKRKTEEVSSTASPQQTMTRCVLAADTLNFLRICLSKRDTVSITNDAICMISFLRRKEVITADLINVFVDLGYDLQDKLVYARLQRLGDRTTFTPEERRVWSAHVKMSLTFGRGQAAYPPNNFELVESLLKENDKRLAIFQHIAKLEHKRHHARARSPDYQWPLFLPTLQHALVGSTLSCIPTQPESAIEPEVFLCNAFLSSLERAYCPPKDKSSVALADETPLSLRDARFFTLAVMKLKKEQQREIFVRLVELLTIASKKNGPHDEKAIHLLARGVCLAAHVADVVTSTGLDMTLSREVASEHYNLPKFNGKAAGDQDTKDAVFMGLFDNYNSPSVPSNDISSITMLSDTEFEKMTELVKSSLELGFKVSSVDRCYLLFSAWNASGKLCSWTPICWEGPSTAAVVKKQDVIDRLINLRDDMCEVWCLFSKNQLSPQQQTLLEKSASSKKGRCRPREALISGITSAEQMIKYVTTELHASNDSKRNVVSLPMFAYFEALPVYLSFLICMHTKPGPNNFSSVHRFSRPHSHVKTNMPSSKYTNDDVLDEIQSDGSDLETMETGVQSLKTRALGRLHSVCISLGAAPCWPDWLDTSCRMQADIVPSIAVDSADSSLSSLTELGVTVFDHYCKALQNALDIACCEFSGKSLPISASLLHLLLASQQHSSLGSGNESFYLHLFTISQTSTGMLTSIFSGKDWLPNGRFAAHSAQRIKGADASVTKDPNTAELRANEQWETILSEVIRGSSLQNTSAISEKTEMRKALEVASHWKRVLYSIVSAMVPTSALLRFGLYDAKGRNPHPLCNDLPESALSSEAVISSHFSSRNEVGVNIKKALAFLSRVCAFSALDDSTLRSTSQAAANHLIESNAQYHFNSMIMLQAIQIRLRAIQGLFGLSNDEPISSAAFAVIKIILDQISSTHSTSALLVRFGLKGVLQTGLIGDKTKVELMGILSSERITEQVAEIPKMFLLMLTDKQQRPSPHSLKLAIAETLCRLIDNEAELLDEKGFRSTGTFRGAAATALNDMAKDEVRILMRMIYPSSDFHDPEITEHLVKLLISLATAEPNAVAGNGCELILENMTENVNLWASFPMLTNLVCILASRFSTLHSLIERVFALAASTESSPNLNKCVQGIFQFAVSLQDAANQGSVAKTLTEPKSNRKTTANQGMKSRTCTFTQTGEGFAEQHWYNCYTCGLLWDKGCCSLCARVCHKDHDVGYSRKSSFFCDCGAEVASGVRPKCKCLSPIDDATFLALNDDMNPSEELNHQDSSNPAEMTFHNYPTECMRTLQLLSKTAAAAAWNETLLRMFNKSFSIDAGVDFLTLLEDAPAISVSNIGKPALDLRCGVPLSLKLMDDGPSMLPVRAAKANSIKIGMMSSSPSVYMRKNRGGRQLIDSDARGRMVCAESNSLSFFSVIPSINTKAIERPHSSHLSRSQLNCLGTEKIAFEVHGVTLASNPNLCAIWGATNACVVVLSGGFDTIERSVTLELQFESESSECESEYLLCCLWLTETILVCVCGTVIHVFDLKTTNSDDSCKATSHFALAYEDVLIRSAVLTQDLSVPHSNDLHKKLVILLDSGRIHFIDLYVDCDGTLEEEGETYIEIGSGTSFPSAGIRRYYGGEPSSAGSTSTTLGEGSSLHFLRQSNLLLYQCVSSPVVAMLIGENGTISGTFELLPSTISSENLPCGDLSVVTGPYLHFQELGTICKEGEVFYRVSCVARVPSSNQQHILLLEFNQSSIVSLKQLLWPPSFSASLGSYSSYSFVGSSTFSAPYLISDHSSKGFTSSDSEVYERAFLTMLSSNGSLLWFGEDFHGVAAERTWAHKDMSTNLYMFEEPSILNVTEDDRIVFGGDCIGKDSKMAKNKLSLNNSEFISSPSRDGCTITARLELDGKGKYASKGRDAGDLAIVAVRVLVGSMPDLIPREISVMGSGRTIKTKRSMKRWYEYVLTDEEVLLAVRNGLVTMNFSSSHDLTSGAVVDAIEVYAKTRSDLPFLTQENNSTSQDDVYLKWQTINEREDQVLYIKSLHAIARILGESKVSIFGTGMREILRQILEKTALDSSDRKQSLRYSTLSLLNQIEEDEAECSRFVDSSTIKGLMSTLLDLESFIKSQTSVVGASRAPHRRDSMLQRTLEMVVHILKISANIARSNGKHYKSTIMRLNEDSASKTSIAINAKRIIDYVAHVSLLYGCTLSFAPAIYFLCDSILVEMCTDSKNFAQFDTVSEYLLNDDLSIVESCCKAITSNCIDTPKTNKYTEERIQDNPNGYVTYQCDACKMFPIKDIRYTIGGEVDIDLCKDCFERGCSYAASQPHDAPLVIHNRTLRVEDEDIPCDSIHQMRGIVIAAPSAGFPEVEDVEAALKMSQTTKEHASSGDGIDREAIRSQLFSHLLSLVPKSLANLSLARHLIHLLLKMVNTPKSEKLKTARGKEMLKSMATYIRDMLQANEDGTHATGKMVVVLRALSSLVTKKTNIDQGMPTSTSKSGSKENDVKGHQHKSKTDPRFICDVHKIPAVRRRCSHGVHKDRRFYVCGLERKHRCSYFKWADTSINENPDKQQDIEEEYPTYIDAVFQTIFEPIQIELTKVLDDGDQAPSIQSQFCSLIGEKFEEMKDYPESDAKEIDVTEIPIFLTMSEDVKEQDAKDGVLKSKIKLGKIDSTPTAHSSRSLLENSNVTASLIYESLYLFSFVASPSQKWGPDWHPVLCAIITDASPTLCHLAKKLLKRLCGDNQDLYHRVRDHHVYGFQFRKLLRQSEAVLDQALIVREMAKQCGDLWRDDEVQFKTLKSAGLIGVGDLISEDCLSVTYERTVQQILDELLSTAGTHARKRNWRNFCALPEIPADSNRDELASDVSIVLEHLVCRPPIMSLLWLSSCLRHSNQVKLLQLVDIALTDIDKDEMPGGDDANADERLTKESHDISHQELALFDVGELHSFVVEFIVNGRSKELRSHAVRVVTKLAARLCDPDKETLLSRLIDGLLRNVAGKFGRTCKEFVELLKVFVQKFSLDLSRFAPCVMSALVSQLTVANNHATKSASPGEVRLDVGNCVHCQNATKKMSTELCQTKENEVWIDEQLRPCVKSRLESSTLDSTHSEYASYFQLKFRLVLSEVHLTVSDPRGRLVKNIGVYFSPRPVGDVNMLKNDKYSRHWQRCGTLNLTRNATTATLKLNAPVVAASLKIKYEDFYEKIGGGSNRAADGSFVLHCPRCTRQVNNAHGVCGNCGEVAFQCRKCRHINYDRLDAFLCVECGYCISGSFSYDVTVGMALNAVAITDEDEYERSVSMLQIASKRHTDLRNSLKKKILAAAQQHSKSIGQDEHIEEMVLYGPHLRRALLGRLPKMNDESEKASSSQSSSSSRQGDPSRSASSNRARSLLSLARTLRNDSAGLGGVSDRLSRTELLQQVLLSTGSSGISSELLDELNELAFGLTDHSLTRTIAGMPDRNPPRSSREVGAALGEDTARGGSTTRDDKRSTSAGECSRIYAQMREAERECYELTRRIEAWNRLNKDALAVTGPKSVFQSPFTFHPTTCSKCSSQIALSLMSLLSSMFESSITQSESVVTPELIQLLITEPSGMNIDLKNMKRRALITLASSSETASRIILKEIQLRLNSVQDVTSAELLGQIVQLDFSLVGEYIDYAVKVLQGTNNDNA